MHHTLRFYGKNRRLTLRLYMFFAGWTKLPLLGRLIRRLANAYGENLHRAYLLTPTEAEQLLDTAGGLAVGPCDCRRTFSNCDHPANNEILLGPALPTLLESMPHDSREITREEAVQLLEDNHRRGLVLTIVKCRSDFYAICSCCSCCCVPLRLSKQYGIGRVLVRHKDIVSEFRRYCHPAGETA